MPKDDIPRNKDFTLIIYAKKDELRQVVTTSPPPQYVEVDGTYEDALAELINIFESFNAGRFWNIGKQITRIGGKVGDYVLATIVDNRKM
jgi:hypothetical protein